mgnify:FL=1
MASTYTINKHFEQPANGDYVGTWNVPVNTDWSAIDSAFGNIQQFNVTGVGPVTIGVTNTAANPGAYPANTPSYVPLVMAISGAPTGNITLQFPAGVGGQWIIRNAISNAYTLTIAMSGGASSQLVPNGSTRSVYCDQATGFYFSDSQTTTAGSSGQVIYNSGGSLAGSSNLTFNGTNLIVGGSVTSSSGGFIFPDSSVQTTAVVNPAGSMTLFAATTAPSGWLECNGSAVSRTTYANLFAAIGTVFGTGDGFTTFNLPDMRGYFARGWDHGAGVDPGRTFGSTQQDALQEFTATWATRADAPVSGAISQAPSSASPTGTGSTATNVLNITIDPSLTARTATETRPKNVALMYIIKY